MVRLTRSGGEGKEGGRDRSIHEGLFLLGSFLEGDFGSSSSFYVGDFVTVVRVGG